MIYPILNTPNATVTTQNSISPDVQSFMHLSHCVNASCGSATMKSSARCQLLELDISINGTLSDALIDGGASH